MIVPLSNCFLYHSPLLRVVVSLCFLPLLINVWHKLVHPLTFPLRLGPSHPNYPPLRPPTRREKMSRQGSAQWSPPRLQRQQVGCRWSIRRLAISIVGAVERWSWGLGGGCWGCYTGWFFGSYPAPVVLLSGGGKQLGVGDGDAAERQVHL